VFSLDMLTNSCIFISMKIYTESYATSPRETLEVPRFWKDVSVLGCILSGILLGIVLLKLFSFESGLPKVHEVTNIKKQLEAEIMQLQGTNTKLTEEIQAMQTDPFYQEKIAREELNLALPDEIIYKFTD
jgi:cell division protein FtsB